jgi:hypothetical protein
MLDSRLVHTFLKGSDLTAKAAGGCLGGGCCLPSCGTLLSMGS